MDLAIPQCTEDTFRLLEVIGSWVAGIGTILAAAVAVYIATWDHKVRMRAAARIGVMIGVPGVSHEDSFVWVSATNIGRRTAVINNVCLRAGIFPAKSPFLPIRHAIWTPDPRLSTTLPAALKDGETAQFWAPLDASTAALAELLDRPYFLSARLFKIYVSDSVGNEFRARLSKELLKSLLAAAHAQSRAKATQDASE